ncbi:MAG: hypothetical protein IPK82_40390 [Polyangiaceae bacterium]|nr:hypothetical protein [Polyangiaceae bacterium]
MLVFPTRLNDDEPIPPDEARRSDNRGETLAAITRAQTLDLCARLAAYAEAGAAQREVLLQAGADATQRFADDVGVLVAVARMYLMAEELGEAENALRRALHRSTSEPDALRLLGEVKLRQGDPTEAHAALARAVACGMSDPWTKTWMARALDYAELIGDLGRDGVARDVRQVLGKPGQGPADDDRRSAPPERSSKPPSRKGRKPILAKIDKGVFFAGDPRAEQPDSVRPRVAADDVVDLPTPAATAPVLGKSAAKQTAQSSGALGAALSSDAAWGREPSYDGDPSSDTQVSAWAPGFGESESNAPVRASEPPRRPRSTEPPPRERISGRVAPVPPRLPNISASELYDEFTEQRRLYVPADVANRASSIPFADRPTRRGPPPLPADETATFRPPGPPPLPAQSGGARIIVVSDPDHGPVTAPPSALIPLEGPVTAPPSALIPIDESQSAPGSVLLPPEPPSLQIPSALLRGTDAAIESPADAPAPAAPTKVAPRPTPRWQRVAVRALMGLLVVAAVFGGFQLYKRNRATKIRAAAAHAAVALQSGGPRGVGDAEAALAGARKIDPKSRAIALGMVRARFFAVIDVDAGRLKDLTAAVEEARALGADASQMSFAEVTRASAQDDSATAVEMIANYDQDPDRTSDALYQLAAGAALEPHDAEEAAQRYRAAATLDPKLLSAQIRLARSLAFSGQPAAAAKILADVRAQWPQSTDLEVLAKVIELTEGKAPNVSIEPGLDIEMVSRPLRSAARALLKNADEQSLAKAATEADIAPVVVLCGDAALRAGNEARAREAAQRAIEISNSYPPAYSLAARVALAAGRFEEARQAALRATADVSSEVRTFIAYEQSDLAALQAAAGPRINGPLSEPIAAAFARLRGEAPLSTTTVAALAKSTKQWADIIAADAALDMGDLTLAHQITQHWLAPEKHPIRARILARLLRYQGKNGAAQAAAASAVPTPAARVEGALAAAEMASQRADALTALQAGRSTEELWATVFLLAREGRDGPARTLLRTLKIPEPESPLLLRTLVVLAFNELHLSRTAAPMFASLAAWTANPDIARGLGVARAVPGEETAAPPPLKGRLPRPNEDPY